MISVKKNFTSFGYITINNDHSFCQDTNGFQVSPKMQELMVYSAQLDSYDNCSKVIKKFTELEVSATQIWRVANLYGEEIGKTISEEVILTPCKKDEVVYAMADGSMVFTREEQWKEVKVGRIFKSSDCIHADEKKGWISNSQYLAYLDTHKKFTHEMEKLLDYYSVKNQPIVFISDGAPWIKNWIEDAYPNAVSILDFYHALEYLNAFAKVEFVQEIGRKKWVEKLTKLLLEGSVDKVIKIVIKLKSKHKEATKLIEYYQH